MKIFLSWSGSVSQKVATTLREWLPCVIQSVKPYVSSEDIKKGTRWSADIAKELQETSFGILCVTKDNLSAPWLNFEAGALSKAIESAHVVPFLFRLKPSDLKGPLLQFQTTASNKEDTFRLLETINNVNSTDDQIPPAQLAKTFEIWWPNLEEELAKIVVKDEPDIKEETKTGKDSEILEELLTLTRNQQRLIAGLVDTAKEDAGLSAQIARVEEPILLLRRNLVLMQQITEDDLSRASVDGSTGKTIAVTERILRAVVQSRDLIGAIMTELKISNSPNKRVFISHSDEIPMAGKLPSLKGYLKRSENKKTD
ncbi:TIR domain-containing protein [Hymenobacter ruricola]|uniref:Toll/interleukin-1 receptor domain-containing protein n=1 Tax=Hymenobacter ruricola TaxID=2791023 RepID=A0ABS0I8A0_9BACT|nr:TIR domain-containing protein [Hymenobacter ruricola]MBF9223129.1 toll/interleukin-1 receptor domain-containing protein [Hymenobacter ruricola]